MAMIETAGPEFRSFMLSAAELCWCAEQLSQPEQVYSEFWRVWAWLANYESPHTDVWILGRRAAKSVIRSVRPWL